MRSEHKTTADEWDIASGWYRIMCSYKRSGKKKRIKQRSHRLDRRIASWRREEF